jgi:hypothetical protein
MKRTLLRIALLLPLFLSPLHSSERVVLRFSPDGRDATAVVREALTQVSARDITLVFESGRYVFRSELAAEQYLAITNHDNGLKRIAFPLDRFDSVRIEGNGAEFIFHGQVLPFLFRGCQEVQVTSLTVDWDVPFYFQATVSEVNRDEAWMEVVPFNEGFSWSVRNGFLLFPNVEGFAYDHLGETLAFDPRFKRVAHGAWDLHLTSTRVEQRPGGRLRFPVPGPHYPEVGTVIVSKGKMGENRYAPAFYGIDSKNIHLEDVTVHHALGMGFLFERCETITLQRCGAYVRPGSDRMVSLIADATHFCNTKGAVLIENSRFQHMLDDGVNVHGTYVEIDQVLNAHQVRVKLMHFQQLGFRFADPGDEVWLIRAPDPGRAAVNVVKAFEPLNERYSVITFAEPINDRLRPGDLLENKTWTPSFTMRGSTIKDHRARGIVLKTPLPIVIENNDISSMMSAIFFRGESRFWFESGAVGDVLIQNNRFEYCAYSGLEHAVMTVTPRLGETFDSQKVFDRNIRFQGNRIKTFGDRIIWADRVDGLTISHNTIIQTKDAPEVHPGKPMIDVINSRNVKIEGNTYEGDNPDSVSADAESATTLQLGENKGFGS